MDRHIPLIPLKYASFFAPVAGNWSSEELLLIEKEAEEGNFVAQYQLGMVYLEGKGKEQSSSYGVKWLKKGAEQGFALAELFFSCSHYDGTYNPETMQRRGVA